MDRSQAIEIYLSGQEGTVDKLLELSQRLKTLEEENVKLKEAIKKIKNYKKREPGKSKSKPWWLWGRKKGHKGAFRLLPDHIDETVPVTARRCPHCDGKLSASQEVMEHVQEDIVPSRVVVTKFLRHRYWCCKCKELITAPPAPDEVPCGYLGPNVLTQMVLLKYHHGLPGNKIVELFKDFCGLKVSEGAIFQALQRLAFWLKVEQGKILMTIRNSSYNHMDETGSKINGVNHWLWATVNPQWAHYLTHLSRGAKVARDILGESYAGGLVTDFYSVYNKVASSKKQQKCRVHLQREMCGLKARDSPKDYLGPYKKLKRLLDDAQRLNGQRLKLKALLYRRHVARLKERLFNFACGVYSNKHWQRLSKRLLKHHKAIFTYLETDMPSDNNLAERMIRRHVILRNRSYQHRTANGAGAYDTLTSILHSLQLQSRETMQEIRRAYLHHRQERPGLCLFPIPAKSTRRPAEQRRNQRRTSIG